MNVDKDQKFATMQYGMSLASSYTMALDSLEKIKYMLRIQNRQEEALLITDAINHIKRANEVFECSPVQSSEET